MLLNEWIKKKKKRVLKIVLGKKRSERIGWNSCSTKFPLYSTGNHIQYPSINHNEKKEYEKQYIHICIIDSLCHTAEINTTLYNNKIHWKEEATIQIQTLALSPIWLKSAPFSSCFTTAYFLDLSGTLAWSLPSFPRMTVLPKVFKHRWLTH